MKNYQHVLAFALEHPWALTPAMRGVVAGILARHIAGGHAEPTEIAAAMQARKNLPQPSRGGVAIIPIYGVIAPRINMMSEMSGGTTFEGLSAALASALANPDVKTIVFDVDSPGGNVAGATEFAKEVLAARAIKPIIAQAQYLMASAAYWPMAAATQIVASPSASVGSIGVVAITHDISEALAKEGVKRNVFSEGKYKAEGMDGGPLSEEAQEHLKAMLATHYGQMVADIAKGRGVTAAAVRNGFGEGRVVTADEALKAGLVDRIGTLADTLARVLPAGASGKTKALIDPSSVTGQEPLVAATPQEPADAQWHATMEMALLELDI